MLDVIREDKLFFKKGIKAFDFHQLKDNWGMVLIPASLFLLILLVCVFFILCEGRKRACCLGASFKLSLAVGQHKAASCLFEGQAKCGQEAYCCALPE